MNFKKPTIFFRTIVGSHMWGQHRSDSDTDMFECYIFDSRSFLLGNLHNKGERIEGENEETNSYEIGHVVKELIKGNINFIWGVMSPKFDLVSTDISPGVFDLRRIVKKNLSKSTVNSVRGFVINNLKDWLGLILQKLTGVDGYTCYTIIKRKEPRLLPGDKKYWKIINTCARTLDFGIKLLNEGVLDFENPIGAISTGEIILLLDELENAYKKSTLPDKSDPAQFEDFLISIRRKEWLIDTIFHDLEQNDMSIDEFCEVLRGIKDAREGNFVE